MILVLEKQKILFSLLLNDIYCTAQNTLAVCTFRSHFLNLNNYRVKRKSENSDIYLIVYSYFSKTIHAATKNNRNNGVQLQLAIVMQSLKKFCLLFTEIFTIL